MVARRGAKGKRLLEGVELVFVPLTSVPKGKKNWGEPFEGPPLPIVLMPFDGRGKKIQHFSESRLGLQMLVALE